MAKMRLDRLLVERGLAATRQQALGLVLAGQVLVDGQKRDKAGAAVAAEAELRLLAPPAPYVSRGGIKLAAALEGFAVDPGGRVCADIGASTGGFTDCLLQQGARCVYALDTGRGQLHWRLRNDPRVVLREQCNVRYLRPGDLPEPVSLITVDVSFISATLLVPALAPLLDRTGGELIVLVKPQFEAGKGRVGRGGIVRSADVQQAAIERVRQALGAAGGAVRGPLPSPIKGAEGNQEFFLAAAWRPAEAQAGSAEARATA